MSKASSPPAAGEQFNAAKVKELLEKVRHAEQKQQWSRGAATGAVRLQIPMTARRTTDEASVAMQMESTCMEAAPNDSAGFHRQDCLLQSAFAL